MTGVNHDDQSEGLWTGYYPSGKVAGTVVIGFVVSKDGTLANFQVFQSVNKYLDAEAVRVIRLMPRWTPAIYGGTPADSYKLQPVVFKIPVN